MSTDDAVRLVAHRLEDGSLDPFQLAAMLSPARQNALGRAALSRQLADPDTVTLLGDIRTGLQRIRGRMGDAISYEVVCWGRPTFRPDGEAWRRLITLLDVLRAPEPYPPFHAPEPAEAPAGGAP